MQPGVMPLEKNATGQLAASFAQDFKLATSNKYEWNSMIAHSDNSCNSSLKFLGDCFFD